MQHNQMIDVETDGRGVATLWLNRPEKHNALNGEMLGQLEDAANAIGADEAVRVVVLAATGKTFCAGGDLAWMKAQVDMDAATRRTESARIATALGALSRIRQPLIGRIHANAFGGGVGLASVCDVAIGVEGAKMGLTETRLGVLPANIGPYVIARMGAKNAREVFMSSRIFDAAEAVRLSILNRAVPEGDLDAAVEAEVEPYLNCAPGAVADAKALLGALAGQVTQDQVDLAIDALAARWETDEAKIGLAAFLDKTLPPWRL